MKRVIVTNDDGIDSVGMTKLVEALSKDFEVYAIAPADQQSAKSMSITVRRDITVTRSEVPGTAEAYTVDGTPTDCVLWALPWFEERGITFDYLFSGINLGANVGMAAYYSGTIGAAREGALKGVRSIALSVGTPDSQNYGFICSMLPRVMEMADSLSSSTILSVNAPDLPPWLVKGVRVAEAAPYGYEEKYAFTPTGIGGSDADTQIEFGTDADTNTLSDADNRSGIDTNTLSDANNRFGIDAEGCAAFPEGVPSAAFRFGMHYNGNDSSEKQSGRQSRIGLSLQTVSSVGINEADLRYDYDCLRYGYAAITPLSTSVSDDVALRKLQGRFASDNVMALFIDVQENIVSGIEMRNRFVGNIGRFASCVKRLDLPVFATELHGLGKAIPEVNIAYSSDRSESVNRREISAWGSGDFARMMASTSARKVLIAGLETHTSVMQTAIDCLQRGYEVMVIEDCCASRRGHDHKMAIERMRYAGCTVTTARAAVMELISTISHPAADSVRKMLD